MRLTSDALMIVMYFDGDGNLVLRKWHTMPSQKYRGMLAIGDTKITIFGSEKVSEDFVAGALYKAYLQFVMGVKS